MRFIYQAKDSRGALRSGELNVDSYEVAATQLRQQSLYVVSLEEAVESSAKGLPSLFAKRITQRDIVEFASQLAVMVDAGVPISSALEGLVGQTDNPTMKSMLTALQDNVQAGEDLSNALAKYPKHFDKAFVNLVKASEASGQLGPMLERIAVQYRTESETRSKIKGALIYPAAMVTMCVGVVIFLLTYVFPKLMPLFAGREKDIPGPTKVLLALSQSMTGYWPWYVGVTLTLIVAFVVMSRPKHLAGRCYGVVVHGDVAGVESHRRNLCDWLDWMGLIDAGATARLDRYIGYFEPYYNSHQALDRDNAVQEEVRNVARAVALAVKALRAGTLRQPDRALQPPRPK